LRARRPSPDSPLLSEVAGPPSLLSEVAPAPAARPSLSVVGVRSISRQRREGGGMLAGDRLISSPVSGDVSPGAQHILCAPSPLPSPEESSPPGEIMRAGRRATVTWFLSEGSAPLSRRREAVESFPLSQARWRGV
jgi:hypothetical protein